MRIQRIDVFESLCACHVACIGRPRTSADNAAVYIALVVADFYDSPAAFSRSCVAMAGIGWFRQLHMLVPSHDGRHLYNLLQTILPRQRIQLTRPASIVLNDVRWNCCVSAFKPSLLFLNKIFLVVIT
jgi:hypothetical protein